MAAGPDKLRAGLRFLSGLLGRGRPLAVYWRVTARCDAACGYCGVRAAGGRELPTGELLQRMSDARRAGMYLARLSGGEPLLRPDLGALIDHLGRLGVRVGVDTNGALVEERLDALRAADTVSLSLDGGAEVHDLHRGPGSHARALRAAERLRASGVPLTLACTITSANHDRLDEVLGIARALGVRALFQPATPWKHASREMNPLAPGPDEVRAALEHLARRRAEGWPVGNPGVYFRAMRGYPHQPPLPCPGGRLACVVEPDGRLGCCDYGEVAHAWQDPRQGGFAAAFARLPRPPACNRCACANTVLLQLGMRLHPEALWRLGVDH